MEVNVKKVWEGKKLDSVIINLFANGQEIDHVKLSDENQWTYTFKDLLKFDDTLNKNEINYTVTEEAVNGYTSEVYGSVDLGFIITNTEETSKPSIPQTNPKPDSVDIYVEKIWEGPKLEAVEINLYADNVNSNKKVILNSKNSWQAIFKELPKYNSNGDLIDYTVSEANVDKNYKSTVLGNMDDGFKVINKYVEDSEKISITGNKVWVLGPEIKPTIHLQLYQNNKEYGGLVALVDGVTTYTWHNLDKKDEFGKNYIYTIDEIGNLDNYDKVISEDGLTVTNYYYEYAGDSVIYNSGKSERIPNTAVVSSKYLSYSSLLISIFTIYVLEKKREK